MEIVEYNIETPKASKAYELVLHYQEDASHSQKALFR
jgi:hypothetical protein